MKSSVAILLALIGLTAPAFSEESSVPAPAIVDKDTGELKFDFDFPGGTEPMSKSMTPRCTGYFPEAS